MQDRQMKSHLHETAESGRVVVPDGLCIAKCLEDGVGLEDLLLHPCRDVRCHAGELKVLKGQCSCFSSNAIFRSVILLQIKRLSSHLPSISKGQCGQDLWLKKCGVQVSKKGDEA